MRFAVRPPPNGPRAKNDALPWLGVVCRPTRDRVRHCAVQVVADRAHGPMADATMARYDATSEHAVGGNEKALQGERAR